VNEAEDTYARALARLQAEEDKCPIYVREREYFERADLHVRATIGIAVFVVVLLVVAEALGYA